MSLANTLETPSDSLQTQDLAILFNEGMMDALCSLTEHFLL